MASDVAEQLLFEVGRLVDVPDPIIAIRSEEGVYLAVNDVWERTAGVSRDYAVGKTIYQLGVIPRDQADKFAAEERVARQQRRLVTINEYNVGGAQPVRFMTVRVLLKRGSDSYLVEVSFKLNPLVTEPSSGWSSRRIEYSFGEELARDLLEL